MSDKVNSEGLALSEYVRETLLAVVGGVLEAQADPTRGAYVGRVPAGNADFLHIAKDGDENTIALVRFDLATTHDNKRGGQVAVIPFPGFGAAAKAETAASLANRISFVVPVSIPKPIAQIESDEARRARMNRPLRRSGGSGSWMA